MMTYLESAQVIGSRWFENLTKLINTIYETAEWPKVFTEVTMIALKNKTQAYLLTPWSRVLLEKLTRFRS
jgi:hypothetical protein